MEICSTKPSALKAVGTTARPAVAGGKFHFIGAGGIGMSGLAKLLLSHGATVTGSDQTETSATQLLRQKGAIISIGHQEALLNHDADAVVISAAVGQENPELQLARKMGLKVYKYAEMLGELMNSYEGIAVAGTHGKSTTCGWLVYLLQQAGVEPSYIIGADITQLGSSSGVGNGRFFVAEACEYDRSFLNLKPAVGAILNIEQDHLDYYRDEDEIIGAFAAFVRQIRPDGVLIAGGNDPNVAPIVGQLRRRNGGPRCETFGLDEACDFHAGNIKLTNGYYSFDVYGRNELLGRAKITVPGIHNVQNALAVVALATNAGVSAHQALELLPHFIGVDRRLTLKGQFRGITVLDDYAHHPTEIKASLAAVRQRYRPKRLWCVFQPHQYSRTRFLLEDFAQSFALADVTIVPEIYFVRDSEAAKKEIDAQVLVERIRGSGSEARFIEAFSRICDYLKENVGCGDLVVTMGAGDIWKVADEYIQWIRTDS